MEPLQLKKLNIIIADDHPIFRNGLKTVLLKINFIDRIFEAENGKEIITIIEQCSINIILTDIEMPEMDGIECTKIVRAKYPDIKIIALTMFDSLKYILELHDAGVHGYLLKNTDLDELTKAIYTIHEGEHYYAKQVLDVLYNGLLKREAFVQETLEFDQITAREIEILKMICEQFTSFEIAEKLFISPKTVERHKENIYIKTGTKNLAGLALLAIKKGYYKIPK